MKVLATTIVLLLVALNLNAQDFKFEKETIDYGKVAKGSNGERTFVFTNIGDAPLIISNIQSSCGCTVPEKPKEPIMPGKTGKIKVSYDTKRVGGFSKSITIYSNAKSGERKVIRIKGNVSNGVVLEKKKSIVSSSR